MSCLCFFVIPFVCRACLPVSSHAPLFLTSSLSCAYPSPLALLVSSSPSLPLHQHIKLYKRLLPLHLLSLVHFRRSALFQCSLFPRRFALFNRSPMVLRVRQPTTHLVRRQCSHVFSSPPMPSPSSLFCQFLVPSTSFVFSSPRIP